MAKEINKGAKAVNSVNTININDKVNEALKAFVTSFNRKDASGKELFINLLSLYRKHNDNKKELILALGSAYNTVSNGNNEIIRKLKTIGKMAEEANEVKLVIKLDTAYYYNIEASIKLMAVLSEEQRTETRKELMACYNKGLTMVAYNNIISSKIKELRKKFNVVDIDGVTVVTTLKQKIDKLSNEEKKELLQYLTNAVK